MSSLVLIDGNPLMWRAAFAGSETFVAEGIVTFFFDIVNKFEDAEVILFWDSGKSRWRSELYTEYKAQRQSRKEEFDLAELSEQKKIARRVLGYFGVRDISVPGVEADDLMAWFAEYFSKEYDQIIVASRDHDLWQLAHDNIIIHDPHSKATHTREDIIEHFGLIPELVADYKALVGDASDNVKGVKGVGAKTAMPLLQEHGGLEVLLDPKNAKLLKKKASSLKILKQRESLDLSYKLVKSPTLQELPYVLSKGEFHVLKHEMSKEVVADSFKAQIELEVLGNPYRISPKFFTGLSERMAGFDTYLDSLQVSEAVSLADVDNSIASCIRCPLRDYAIPPQFGRGVINANVMVITSRVLTEDHRNRIDLLFDTVMGENYKSRWVTSACRCPSMRPATYGEYQACSSYTLSEIEFIKPKLIIAIGDEAMGLVSDYKCNSSKHAGELFKSDKFGAYVSILPGFESLREADWEFGVGKLKEFIDKKRSK